MTLLRFRQNQTYLNFIILLAVIIKGSMGLASGYAYLEIGGDAGLLQHQGYNFDEDRWIGFQLKIFKCDLSRTGEPRVAGCFQIAAGSSLVLPSGQYYVTYDYAGNGNVSLPTKLDLFENQEAELPLVPFEIERRAETDFLVQIEYDLGSQLTRESVIKYLLTMSPEIHKLYQDICQKPNIDEISPEMRNIEIEKICRSHDYREIADLVEINFEENKYRMPIIMSRRYLSEDFLPRKAQILTYSDWTSPIVGIRLPDRYLKPFYTFFGKVANNLEKVANITHFGLLPGAYVIRYIPIKGFYKTQDSLNYQMETGKEAVSLHLVLGFTGG